MTNGSDRPELDPVGGDEANLVEGLVDEYVRKSINRRQFFKRAGALGITLSGAAALLAACGGDDDSAEPAPEPAPDEPAPEPAPEEAPPEEAPAPEPAAGEPVAGGTLIEGYDRDFTAMDTVQTGWADPAFVALYEFTVIRDPNGAFVPAVVDSWEISDDLLTWTFTIRDGLTFHGGQAADAEMMARNFNAFRSPDSGQNAIFWPAASDAVASDATTFSITWEAPNTAFPETLATEFSMIENLDTREAVGEDYGASEADGTGPFTLANFSPGIEVLVNRWDDYPGTNIPYITNSGPAYLDAVQWVPIIESGQRANEIETGNVHIVKNPAGQDVSRLEGNGDLTVISFPALANYFIGLNHQKTETGFDDVRVRQAVSAAIDRQAIADSLFFGQAVATQGPIANNWRWYEPGVEAFNVYDPEAAGALLDEAGWTMGGDGIREKDGTKLSFTVVSNAENQPTTRGIDEAMVAMLADVGVEMLRNVPDAAEFFNVVLDAENTPDAWTFEWLWSSPMDLLIFFQAFPSVEFNGALPEIAAAVEKYQTGADEATLEAASREMQLAWAELLPEIPVVTTNNIWVHQNNVMGYTPLQTMLYPQYNDVWLA